MSVLFALATEAASPVCYSASECAGQGVDTFLGTPQRVWASVAALVSLAGLLIAWLARRSARRTGGRTGKIAIIALVLGLTGALNGAADLAIADGGLGTGNGVFGAVVAVLVGLTATLLAARALTTTRSHPTDLNA